MRDALGEAVDFFDLFPTQQYLAEAAVGAAIGKLIQRNGLSGVNKRPPRMPYPRRGPPNYWHSKTGRDLSGWREEARNNGGFLSRTSAQKFRSRYRMPLELFEELVKDCREYGLGVTGRHENRSTTAPLPLLVLSALRMLGRGSCPNDDSDHTNIQGWTIRQFFHRFCSAIVLHKAATYLTCPRTEAGIQQAVVQYARRGFPGCIGSTDVVHVPWDRVPAALVSAYIGKEGIPTVAYEVTVRHDRWIMAASQGFAGSWNDKTIVHYDTFVNRFRSGDLYGNVQFEVQVSATETKKIRGLYLICDGGYHKWRCMQCPFPEGRTDDERAWSQELMSLRKDVECVFGILKQRFRILKLPQLWMADADGRSTKLDNVFQTCCVLHNMLLNTDSEAFEADHDTTRVHKLWLLALHKTITIQPSSDFACTDHELRNRTDCTRIPRLTTLVETDVGTTEKDDFRLLRMALIQHYSCYLRLSRWSIAAAQPIFHQGWRFNAPHFFP
jgi:hypothetical protein